MEITSGCKEKKLNDNGKLICPHPEPASFLADPGHQKKTLETHVCRLQNEKIAFGLGVTNIDALKVSTDFAHVTNALPTMG